MQEIINNLIASIKEVNGYKPRSKSIDLANRIELHYSDEVGDKAKKILKEKAPNQSKEDYHYELSNFRIWSRRIVLKQMGMFAKVANPNNYSYTTSDEDLNEYLDNKYPFYGNFKNYVSSSLLDGKLLDSNSVRVTKPFMLPSSEIDGEFMLDDTQNIKAIDEVFESKRVVHYQEEELFIGLSNDKSEVIYNKRKEKTGLIFEVYDRDTIYHIKQKGKKTDWLFDIEIYYTHSFGFLPANQVKGKLIIKNGKSIFNSPLNFITDELDSYLKISSNLNTALMSRVFAERIEVIDHDCLDCRGTGEIYELLNGEETAKTCTTCHGTRTLPRPSAISTKFIKPDAANPEKNSLMYPGVTYVAPPIEGLAFLDKLKKEKEQEIYQTLNQKLTSSTATGKEQTATGEQIDREEQYTMLMQFVSQLFESVNLSLKAHTMYWSMDATYQLTEPVSYNIRTEEDLNREINDSDNTPSALRIDVYKQFVQKRFSKDATVRKYLSLISKVDRLFGMSPSEKQSSMTAKQWELILSESIVNFIENIDGFEDMTTEVKKSTLIAMAKSYVEATPSVDDIV
jgi:hypothetical protein